MFTEVVVADAGMRREDRGRLVLALGRRARRNEHSAIAETARVEDRRELADHPRRHQRLGLLDHGALIDAEPLGERCEGPLDERELVLDGVEESSFEVVHGSIVPPHGTAPDRADRSELDFPRTRDNTVQMSARRLPALILLLMIAVIGVMASGCFQAHKASEQVTGEVTIGAGTGAQVVTAGGSGDVTTAADTSSTESSTTTTTTGAPAGGAPAGADVAAGKSGFTNTCGSCHTLKDAGTKGQVGPVLDSLAPLAYDRVAKQIKNGSANMTPCLAAGQDLINIAAYVSRVAGK